MARGKKSGNDLISGADPSAFPSYLGAIASKLSKSYDFVSQHHSGKTGQTYQIRLRSDRAIYCLKTVREDWSDKSSVRTTLAKEVDILRPLSHRCLPKIYEHDFASALPYYVCTFHPGDTWSNFRAQKREISVSEATYVITSLIDTLEYLHSQGRTHCDLHEENILIGPRIVADGILIIDLGSGHRLTADLPQTHDRGHLPHKALDAIEDYRRTVDRREKNDDFQKSDFKALGRLLLWMVEPFFGRANSDQQHALRSFAYELQRERITDWKAAREQFEYVLNPDLLITRTERFLLRKDGQRAHITLPASGRVRVGDAVLAVVNTPTFQRLRGIKQLSFCEWYFPGATHTRFEHSVGVFGVAQRALRSLCRDVNVKARFNQRNIDGALLASLVHDVGHYPFAHVIEHYVAARYPTDRQLKHDIHHFDYSLYLIQNEPALRSAIEKHWSEDVLHEVVKNLSGKAGVLSEILDGPVDCDKLDYLRRDAHHCGVPYGAGLHTDEIISSFTCSPRTGELVIPEERIAAIEGMILAQDQMLSTVYWAKTTRALFSMFHRFLDIVVGQDTEKLRSIVAALKKTSSDIEAMREVFPKYTANAGDHAGAAKRLISLHDGFDFNALYLPIKRYSPIDATDARRRSFENVYQKIVQNNQLTTSLTAANTAPINWVNVRKLRSAYVKALRQRT